MLQLKEQLLHNLVHLIGLSKYLKLAEAIP